MTMLRFLQYLFLLVGSGAELTLIGIGYRLHQQGADPGIAVFTAAVGAILLLFVAATYYVLKTVKHRRMPVAA